MAAGAAQMCLVAAPWVFRNSSLSRTVTFDAQEHACSTARPTTQVTERF
jgi:hypothetical protein